MCLKQTFAENYLVLVHANFNVPKIQNSECQAGFESIHKTVYELCELPVKGTLHTFIYGFGFAAFRTPSPRSGCGKKQVSLNIQYTL
jgi:hypothetical protein